LIEEAIASGGAEGPVITAVKARTWGTRAARLTTFFMDNPPRDLRREILRHLNMWGTRANVNFVESQVDPIVRIDRRTGRDWGGYWSWVGTEILRVPRDEPTMNLEGFTMRTSASEFRRVVCHEAGHTLGFPHEHMRRALVQLIDREKAYAYFRDTEGWTPQDVEDQVLTPLDDRTIFRTPPDQTSIMCYQLPGSITRNGRPIIGGTRINETDYEFAARLYPRPPAAPGRPTPRKKTARKARRRSTVKKGGARKSAARKGVKRKGAAKKGAAKRGAAKKRVARKRATTKRGAK
jgi:hypothetical protein